MSIKGFWGEFLKESGLPADTVCSEYFHFELSEYWANELLRLVLTGQKKAPPAVLRDRRLRSLLSPTHHLHHFLRTKHLIFVTCSSCTRNSCAKTDSRKQPLKNAGAPKGPLGLFL